MALKIAVIGPESTGKTELTRSLAKEFDAPYVEEFSRHFLEKLSRPYTREDLIEIARGQINWEEEALKTNPHLLFCDTNLVVMKIWSVFKYEKCDPRIQQWMNERHYDLTLITKPDIPWAYDPLRESPESREELFELYLKETVDQQIPYKIIYGENPLRLQRAIDAIRIMVN